MVGLGTSDCEYRWNHGPIAMLGEKRIVDPADYPFFSMNSNFTFNDYYNNGSLPGWGLD